MGLFDTMSVMMRAVLAVGLALLAGAGTVGSLETGMTPQSDLAKLLPASVPGWTADPKDERYDAETIFDYIDGAGEVYRAYNMKALLSRRYRNPGGPDIIADLFDMGSSADAFGVFSHDLDGEDWGLGQASLYKGGLLNLWRGRYFLAVFAEGESAESAAALREIGRRAAAAIAEDGAKPDLLTGLPAGYDDPRRVRYLHSPVILNYHIALSRENVLKLDGRTDVVLSKADDKSVLIQARYPDEALAEAALGSFRAALMPGSERGRPYRAEDGSFSAAGRHTRLVIIVMKAPTAAAADAALAAAAAKR